MTIAPPKGDRSPPWRRAGPTLSYRYPYERDLWYLAPNTIGPVAKKQPLSTLSSTDGAWQFFKKYLETLYGNLIEL